MTNCRGAFLCRCIPNKCRSYLLSGRNVGLYADRVACCPLVSHGEYADGTDRLTDGRQTVTLRFLLDAASVIKYWATRSTYGRQEWTRMVRLNTLLLIY